MNNIYIHKNEQQHGPYTEEQVRNFLYEGRFTSADMGWTEGAADWKPLGDMLAAAPNQPPPVRSSNSPPQQQPQMTTQPNPNNPKGLIIASWLMIGLTCLVSLIPGIGFATWLIAAPVLLVTFILGIIALTKGGTLQGILILLTSLIVAPIFLLIAPIVTTAGAVAAAESSSSGSSGNTLSSSSSTTSSTSSQTQPTSAPKYEVGQTISTPGLDITVLTAKKRGRLGNEFFSSSPSEGAVYVAVTWQYKNTSSQPLGMFERPSMELKDANGVTYSPDLGASGSYATEVDFDEKVMSDLNPGITVKTADVFEVSSELIQNPGWRIVINADKKIEMPLPQ